MTHHFIKNRDIVLFSSQPWNSGIAFNFKDMAFELARYNRVLFIDRARDRHSILKTIFSSKEQEYRKQGNSRTDQGKFMDTASEVDAGIRQLVTYL